MKYLVSLLLLTTIVSAGNDIPDEALKIEALKLGYELNGNSMKRDLSLGAIDLSGPPPSKKTDRLIPLTPEPKKKTQ